MGVIESMQTMKGLWTGIAIGFIVLAGLFVTYQMWPEHKFSTDQAYFTDDDGQTWYLDSINNIPPYTHNGKEAVKAVIDSYAGGSKQFCAYLISFSPETKKAIEAAVAGAKDPNTMPATIAYGMAFGPSIQVKKPNSKDPWAPINSVDAKAVFAAVKSPDGSELDTVLP